MLHAVRVRRRQVLLVGAAIHTSLFGILMIICDDDECVHVLSNVGFQPHTWLSSRFDACCVATDRLLATQTMSHILTRSCSVPSDLAPYHF